MATERQPAHRSISSHRLHDVARHEWVLGGGGQRHGDRTLPTPGGSTTWFDARPYQEGDDLRYVDWRGYARSRRLHTRLHMAERGVDRTVFVDESRSMDVGGKRAWRDAIVDVLGRARGGDGPLSVHGFGAAAADGSPGSLVEAWLDAWRSSSAFSGRHAVVVVSDLLTEASWAPSWRAVTARGAALTVVQVLARSEIDPTFGASTLHDVETRSKIDVTVADVEAYRLAVQAFLVERRREATRARAGYARLVVPGPSTQSGSGSPAQSAPERTLMAHAFSGLVKQRVIARP